MFHQRAHKRMALSPILSQLNLVQLTTYFSATHFNIIRPSNVKPCNSKIFKDYL